MAFVLGHLDEARAVQVRQHIEQCKRCRRQVSDLQHVLDLTDELARVQPDVSLQMAARKALNRAGKFTFGHSRIWVELIVAALILIGALVTLQVRRWHRGPEQRITQDEPKHLVTQMLEIDDQEPNLIAGSSQLHLQQALVSFERGGVKELHRIFTVGNAHVQSVVIGYLAALDDPKAETLLMDIVNNDDLAPAVRQAAVRALKGGDDGPVSHDITESNQPVLSVPEEVVPPLEPSTDNTLELEIIDGDTGDPIADVHGEIRWYTDDNSKKQTVYTDPEGRCRLDHHGKNYERLAIKLFKPGYVPMDLFWQDNKPFPWHLKVTMERGIPVGGVVKTDTGEPIVGVHVTLKSDVLLPVGTPRNYSYVYRGTVATDQAGRWVLEHFPSGAQEAIVSLRHPDYRHADRSLVRVPLDCLIGLDFTSLMRKGFRVTGRVTDRTGVPIASASVAYVLSGGIFGSGTHGLTETKTDIEGLFCFENCRSGHMVLTVKAADYAQDRADMMVGQAANEINFLLEPERTLTVKVVDPNGTPIQGAVIRGCLWRERRALHQESIRIEETTDIRGVAVLRTLPADTVGYRITKDGYTGRRCYTMAAIEGKCTVTLWPQGRVTGHVYDKTTGALIRSFTCLQGIHSLGEETHSWPKTRMAPMKCENGQYDAPFVYQTDGVAVLIQTPGYQPYESPIFYNEGVNRIHNVYLKPGDQEKAVEGTVYEPDGSPAAKAWVEIVLSRHCLVRNGRVRTHQPSKVRQTDRFGQFRLPFQKHRFKLLILSDRGFAELDDADIRANPAVWLRPWGRIEGVVYSGLTPQANASISVQAHSDKRWTDQQGIHIHWGYATTADQQGRFTLDRVRPGSVNVYRTIHTSRILDHRASLQVAAEVLAGQTHFVQIGGHGRKVTGSFVLPDLYGIDILSHGRFSVYLAPNAAGPQQVNRTDGLTTRAPCVVQILDQQAFLIDDITPGRYTLQACFHDPRLYNDLFNRTAYHSSCVAEINHVFTVPKPHSDEEYNLHVDLGEVPVMVGESCNQRMRNQ